MQVKGSKIWVDKFHIAILSFMLLICLWDLSILFTPVLLLIGIVAYRFIRDNQNVISFPYTFLYLCILLFFEIINFSFSIYRPNSILFLKDFYLIICCIFLINQLLISKKYFIYFVIFISILGGALAFFNIPIFFFKYYQLTINGFNDFSQFRSLYTPLGFISNEWVTILLCFLPFPCIGIILFSKKILVRYVFVFIITLLVFNIFISFSRAGFLSFFIFIGLLNILLLINCNYSLKKLFLPNFFLIVILFLFSFFFLNSIKSSVIQTVSHQRSMDGRIGQWGEILGSKISSLGVGSKNYSLVSNSFQEFNLEYSFTGRINNTYLQLLLEKGWLGLFLWVCIIGVLVFYSYQQIRREKNKQNKIIACIVFSGISTVLFREFFFSSLLYNSGLLLLFFILLLLNNKKKILVCENVIYQRFIFGLVFLFLSSLIYFHFNKMENALYFASEGLKHERSINYQTLFSPQDDYIDLSSGSKGDTLQLAIQFYKKALQLSPSDAMFKHNLAWLYKFNQLPDSALIYISQAVSLEPNVALYHISNGLLLESKNIERAFDAYEKAILLSPDIIDSQFFNDLKNRMPQKTDNLLKKASCEFAQILTVQYSSIIDAKNGKLMLSLGNFDKAEEIFQRITLIHPNLSRPWYCLGLLEYKKENYAAMKINYEKSMFLSPQDHMPLYAFASYYNNVGEKQNAEKYLKIAKKVQSNIRSVHSNRCKKIYFSDAEFDDVIPNGLLCYTTPIFPKRP